MKKLSLSIIFLLLSSPVFASRLMPFDGMSLGGLYLDSYLDECDHGINFSNGSTYENFSGVVSCRDKETKKLIKQVTLSNGKENGAYSFYDRSTGKQIYLKNYKNGELDGLSKYYYPESGKLKAEHLYTNGQRSGLQKDYYENGKLRTIFQSNKTNPSPKIHFHENGTLAWIECGDVSLVPEDNRWCGRDGKVGEVSISDRQGRLEATFHFLNSQFEGEQREYHSNGKLASVTTYQKGQAVDVKTFSTEGVIEKAQEKIAGDTTSEVSHFEDGKKKKIIEWKGGEKRSETLYYQNGNKKSEKVYKGTLIEEKNYFDNGKIESHGTSIVQQGIEKQEGEWEEYRKDGTLSNKSEYLKGVLQRKKIHDEQGQYKETQEFYPDGSRKY